MDTCVKCDKSATFIVPTHLCDEHWAEWWVDDDRLDGELSYEDRITLYLECYEVIRHNHPVVDPPWLAECRARRLAGERAFRIRSLKGLMLVALVLVLFTSGVLLMLNQ